MKTLSVVVVVLACLTASTRANDQYITPIDPVAGHPDLTYADLLKKIIPDLAEDGSSGHLPEGIRHIDDSDGEVPSNVSIQSVDVEHVEVAGKPTLWLLTDLGEGGTLGTYTLLSVFSDEAQPKLIDAAEVDADRFTNFTGDPLRISKTDQAMLVDSNHFNSEQNYSSQELTFVHDGKLAVAASFLVFGVHSCHVYQEETLMLTSKPATSPHWPFAAVIRRLLGTNKADAETCVDETPAGVKDKSFKATFKWNAAKAKYETNSKEFEQLEKADQALF